MIAPLGVIPTDFDIPTQSGPKKKLLLEEELRSEMVIKQVGILNDLIKELKRRYPDYELIYRGDHDQWVFYWIKHHAASPAGDVLSKQVALPPGITPGMWFIRYLQEKDRAGQTFKEWWAKVREDFLLEEQRKKRKKQDLRHEMKREFDQYVINRHVKQKENMPFDWLNINDADLIGVSNDSS